MRISEIISGLLLESVSDILFHSTSPINAARIIEGGVFTLQADFAKGSENKASEPMFYLSTSRSRIGEYHAEKSGHSSSGTVLLQLDGRKLGQRYGGSPVDYWEFMGTNAPLKDEMEDRVFSRNREIPSTPYIMRVDVLYTRDDTYTRSEYVYHLYRLCSRNNIEFRIFSDRQSFITGRNPEPLSYLKDVHTTPTGRVDVEDRSKMPHARYNTHITQVIMAGSMVLKGLTPKKEDLDKFFGHYGYDNEYYRKDFMSQFKNELHNESKGERMQELVRLMRSFGVRTPQELVEVIYRSMKEKGI